MIIPDVSLSDLRLIIKEVMQYVAINIDTDRSGWISSVIWDSAPERAVVNNAGIRVRSCVPRFNPTYLLASTALVRYIFTLLSTIPHRIPYIPNSDPAKSAAIRTPHI